MVVTDASTDDRQGLVELLTQYFADGVKRLRKLWVDGAYPAEWLEAWVRGLKQTHKIDLESTTNQAGKGFQVVPWRILLANSDEHLTSVPLLAMRLLATPL